MTRAVVIGAVAGATAALVFLAVLLVVRLATPPHRFSPTDYAVEHFSNGDVVTVYKK